MNEDSKVQLEITKAKLFHSKERELFKKEMEELRHKHILEEIEAMRKAKITQFVRQISNIREEIKA